MSWTCYPDPRHDLKCVRTLLGVESKTEHKIKDQLNVSNRKSCHVYMYMCIHV